MKIIVTMEKSFTRAVINKIIILFSCIILLYLVIAFYFNNHYLFHTTIGGVDVSIMKYEKGYDKLTDYARGYKLTIVDVDKEHEVILGKTIQLRFNPDSKELEEYIQKQKAIFWIGSLIEKDEANIDSIYIYNGNRLHNTVNALSFLTKPYMDAVSPTFLYQDGEYIIQKEKEGTKLNQEKVKEVIHKYVSEGKQTLDLYQEECYEKPKYTVTSQEVTDAKNTLNKYLSTKITYKFGDKEEVVDATLIRNWLSVDENMNVIIDEKAVAAYIKTLADAYDTVGGIRQFKTSTGQIVTVKGGLYGWKINQEEETQALIENIKSGKVLVTEPFYSQTARDRGPLDIGDTYVEINITKQRLWYYVKGKLYASGSIVTGNPNKGNGTVLGTNMINYKQKNVTLIGPNYEAEVKYWMPFYGNIGMHDASWRYRFGGDIYQNRGSHGCVNLPVYLAKRIFEHIEEGTPVITYVEE